jgi:YVTN family beta-propeller protein
MGQFRFTRHNHLVLNLIGIALLAAAMPAGAWGQNFLGQISTGSGPSAEAVNPVTNKIYVANQNSNSVSVIDGATESVSATVTVGNSPSAVALNPVTNKIYVANSASGTVTVINGADNTTATVTVGSNPVGLAVNTVSNKIYVANKNDNSVTVINGADNSTATVTAGTGPMAAAVNAASNKIYVANFGSNNVTVINGADNSTATVAAGTGPAAVAVNAVTNTIYVANENSNNVTVITGANNSTATVGAGTSPVALAVNPVSNTVYVANLNSGNVTVINGSGNTTTTVTIGTSPAALAVDVVTNQIYVANSGNPVVIHGADNTTTFVPATSNLSVVAMDPVTNKIYFTGRNTTGMTVIDGATNNISLTAPGTPMAVNLATNTIYTANLNNVTVIHGADNSTTTFALGARIKMMAANPVTNKIYVSTAFPGTPDLTVIDGASNAVTSIPGTGGCTWPLFVPPLISSPWLAVNPATNKIYGTCGNQLLVIDGASLSVTTVPLPLASFHVAVNPATNKIYVTNWWDASVTIVDGNTNNVIATLAAGAFPDDVAVNTLTNRIYEHDGGGCPLPRPTCPQDGLTVIDGATDTATTLGLTDFGFTFISNVTVNWVTNKIYLNNPPWMIDGATNSAVSIGNLHCYPAAVNPTTNKIYGGYPNPSGFTLSLCEIDGAFNAVFNSPGNAPELPMVVNPVTNKVYNSEGRVLTEQQVSAIPLTTTITPLPNNVTANPAPTFTFTTSSTYAPTAPAVGGVYYQFDTWQGPWLQVSGTPPTFTTKVPTLQRGTHILFAYATDAQLGDGQSGPIIGQIAAYVFTVTGTNTTGTNPFLTLTAGINSATVKRGQAAIFTFTVNASVPGSVTLQCSGLPHGATCGFAPSTPANNGSTTETLTVQTTAPPPFVTNQQLSPFQETPVYVAMLMSFPVLGLLYAGIGGDDRRKKKSKMPRLVVLGAVLLVSILALTGCGGLLRELPPEELPTPPGTYTITVTATSGNLSAQTSVTLTVTP